MNVIVEDVPEHTMWKIWYVDSTHKNNIGYVSYKMGAEELIYTVKELEDRWSSETKNLMYNTIVYMDNHTVYSDYPVPYIYIEKEEE